MHGVTLASFCQQQLLRHVGVRLWNYAPVEILIRRLQVTTVIGINNFYILCVRSVNTSNTAVYSSVTSHAPHVYSLTNGSLKWDYLKIDESRTFLLV